MTIHELIDRARCRLERAGLRGESARVDADLLAREALGWDRADLVTRRHEQAPPGFETRYEEWVDRRVAREPAALIVGHREFWHREFELSPGVLVPRPETEFIVEEALALFDGQPAAGPRSGRRQPLLVADVGTGSGCLAVTLAAELDAARVVATDLSGLALAVAARNARRHGVAGRVQLVQADLLEGIEVPRGGEAGWPGFDLIVSNPPYVPARSIAALQPEVRVHEPAVALDGGPDGLAIVRRLLDEAIRRLRPGGWLVFEFGDGQEEDVERAVAQRPGATLRRVRDDLQGIPRTAVVRRGEAN